MKEHFPKASKLELTKGEESDVIREGFDFKNVFRTRENVLWRKSTKKNHECNFSDVWAHQLPAVFDITNILTQQTNSCFLGHMNYKNCIIYPISVYICRRVVEKFRPKVKRWAHCRHPLLLTQTLGYICFGRNFSVFLHKFSLILLSKKARFGILVSIIKYCNATPKEYGIEGEIGPQRLSF